jgi:hypothetical protein
MKSIELIDQTEYIRRANLVQELSQQHPADAKRLSDEERDRLERYFLGALKAADPNRYRSDQRKLDPTIESLGNRAYERLLAEIGVPASLQS